jgi:hypothetical protein
MRAGLARRNVASTRMHHTCPHLRTKVSGLVNRSSPVTFAEFVTHVVAKKRADALRTKVSHSIGFSRGQDDGVCQDNTLSIHASLEIAENHLAVGMMVRKVAQRLHDSRPRCRTISPTRVRVELLIILDKRFLETLSASPTPSSFVNKRPHFWYV